MVRVPRYYGIAPTPTGSPCPLWITRMPGCIRSLQVQHVMDSDGLSATDITLERTGALDGST